MPCYHPIPAWRQPDGTINLNARAIARATSSEDLLLPCGGCIGCRKAKAREWAVRCTLEQQDHASQCWTTLTYEEKYKPPTLQKDHVAGWLKRLRARIAPDKIRFFATGEYGERTRRPHYHSILYGLPADNREIQNAWPFGNTHTLPLNAEGIAYVAGYVNKKLHWRELPQGEQVDPDTGEVYIHQPSFIQMSRRPGIGGNARQYWHSWRTTAIDNKGREIPVPRYLHNAWKANATPQQIEELSYEQYIKLKEKILNGAESTPTTRHNRELHAISKHQIATSNRKTL